MGTATFTQVRENFKKVMDQVCDDHAPITITRQKGSPVVMLSLEDYSAMQETMYLIRSPQNAKRLKKAMSDIQKGKYSEYTLIAA